MVKILQSVVDANDNFKIDNVAHPRLKGDWCDDEWR